MTDPGYYDTSIPPALLVGRGRRVSAPARAAVTRSASGARLTAGPEGYAPAVKAPERPRNLQELQERVEPLSREPWAVGASVPIGVRGKMAHWTGTEWKTGRSPGYQLEEAQVDQLEGAPALEDAAAALEGQQPAEPVAAVLEDPPVADAPWNAPAATQTGTGDAVPTAAESPAPAFPGDEAAGDLSR